ncbi:hypothetical protein H0O02_01330 [Candidatus Micrarchaeota archaeon]|nr:hypothetical protein [Candidatus Micrarchaeota archaeon]
MTNGGMAQKVAEKAVEEAPAKMKVTPKKEATPELQILEKASSLKKEIKTWYEDLAWYREEFDIPKTLNDEDAILALRILGNGATTAALNLLYNANEIMGKKGKLDAEIEKGDFYGVFIGNKDYDYLFLLQGGAFQATVESVEERIGWKKPEPVPLQIDPELQEQMDKYKEKKLLEETPSISAIKGPMPSPAEELEIIQGLKNPLAEYGLITGAKKELSKEEKLELLELFIVMIPVVGSVYSLGVDVKHMKDKYEFKKEIEKEIQAKQALLKKNIATLSVEERSWLEYEIGELETAKKDYESTWKDWAWLSIDVAFVGLDVTFIGSFAVKTGAKWVGRDAAAAIKAGEQTGKVITAVEKDLMVKAMTELSANEQEHLFKLAKEKGGLKKVFYEMAESADKKEISAELMKNYLLKNPLPKGAKAAAKKGKEFVNDFISLQDGLSMFSKQKFQKQMVVQFYKELVPTIDFQTVRELSDLMSAAKLGASEKYAVDAILYSCFSFEKKPQQALLKLLKEGKTSWKDIVQKIVKEEKALKESSVVLAEGESITGKATRNVLIELLPEYKSAYKKAPFDHWIKLGIFMGGIHAGFVPLSNFIRAKLYKEQQKYEGMMEKLTESKEADAVMNMLGVSLAISGEDEILDKIHEE